MRNVRRTAIDKTDQDMATDERRDAQKRKQVEKALRESEERYRAATEAVGEIIWTNNADGLMEGEQPGWAKMTGQSLEEYQGYGWSKAVHADDAQPTIDQWNRAVADKRTFVFEHRIRRHDGEWRHCSVRAVPVLNSDGTIREWVGVHTDITERKRADEELRASEEFNRTVLESSPDCVKILDGSGRLHYMNFNGLCQLEIDDFALFKNEFWWKLWGVENVDMVKQAVQKALQGETAQFQAFCPTAKGTPKWWDVIVSPIPGVEGRIERLISVSRDITGQKRTEEALRLVLDQLEARVVERTQELARTNSDLVAEIAHRTIVEEQKIALLQRVVKTQEDERRRIARDIHDQMGQRLTGLRLRLQSLIGAAGADPGMREHLAWVQETCEAIDADIGFLAWELRPPMLIEIGLEKTLAEYVSEWSKRSRTEAIFSSTGVGSTRFDPEIEINLYRITQEALNNAAKYSEADSVSVLLRQSDDSIVLMIEDDGTGFDLTEKRAIGPGHGFGLRGMGERANIIGGQFAIESVPGRGTTVTVKVPIDFNIATDNLPALQAATAATSTNP